MKGFQVSLSHTLRIVSAFFFTFVHPVTQGIFIEELLSVRLKI